eukprot:GFYU01033616.1.p1 GENE.GFYU01033616.1~~GFYU01033616.1.p1  ORF type:complete len:591 (+),score=115.98 GFYU01033616.1:28-1800(+)
MALVELFWKQQYKLSGEDITQHHQAVDAVFNGMPEGVRSAFLYGDNTDFFTNTPVLIHALGVGSSAHEVVELLVKAGADVTVRTGGGKNTVAIAASQEFPLSTLQAILESWKAKNAESLKTAINEICSRNMSPLMCLAAECRLAESKLLVEYGADPHLATEDDTTCVMMACNRGGFKATMYLKWLLDQGCDPNKGSINPLFLVVQEGNMSQADLLLQHGAQKSLNPKDPFESPLLCAARFGFDALTKRLIAEGSTQLEQALQVAREGNKTSSITILSKALGVDSGLPKENCTQDTWSYPMDIVATRATDGITITKSPLGRSKNLLEWTIQGKDIKNATVQTTEPFVLTAGPETDAACHACYYEMTLVRDDKMKEEDSRHNWIISMGFSRDANYAAGNLPGWIDRSFGVHFDDGVMYTDGNDRRYLRGSAVKDGMTVGVGIELVGNEYQFFATLNGKKVPGHPHSLANGVDERMSMYPLVGLDKLATLRVKLTPPFKYHEMDKVMSKRRTQANKSAEEPSTSTAPKLPESSPGTTPSGIATTPSASAGVSVSASASASPAKSAVSGKRGASKAAKSTPRAGVRQSKRLKKP